MINIIQNSKHDLHMLTIGQKKAGCFVIAGDFRIFVKTKPKWLSRFLLRWLLQWDWEDCA